MRRRDIPGALLVSVAGTALTPEIGRADSAHAVPSYARTDAETSTDKSHLRSDDVLPDQRPCWQWCRHA
jgi:hypothetical protein